MVLQCVQAWEIQCGPLLRRGFGVQLTNWGGCFWGVWSQCSSHSGGVIIKSIKQWLVAIIVARSGPIVHRVPLSQFGRDSSTLRGFLGWNLLVIVLFAIPGEKFTHASASYLPGRGWGVSFPGNSIVLHYSNSTVIVLLKHAAFTSYIPTTHARDHGTLHWNNIPNAQAIEWGRLGISTAAKWHPIVALETPFTFCKPTKSLLVVLVHAGSLRAPPASPIYKY